LVFLLSCVIEKPLRIQIGNRALPITAEVVHQVFGLPASGKSLPNYNVVDKRDARAELRKLCDAKGLESMFTRRGGNYARLGVSEVPRWFIEHYANVKEADVDDWTMQSFLMLVFNTLLFPTGSDKMAGVDYLMCAYLSDVPEINWCQAIVVDIKVKARDLNDKITSNDKSTPNVQGCIAFPVVSFCQLFLFYFLCLPFIIFVIGLFCLPFITIFNFRSAISCLGQPFHIVSAILHTLSAILHTLIAIPCLGQPFYTMLAIFMLYQPFQALPAISMLC
jgi:hypothetical protein